MSLATPLYREKIQSVLARAVARLATLTELTIPLCKPGGKVIIWK